jgi:hypothetical protein
MNKPDPDLNAQSFFSVALSRTVVVRAIKVALLVGTILALVNHGDKLLSMSLSSGDWFKVILTYLVPYGVSTYSAVGALKANASTWHKIEK